MPLRASALYKGPQSSHELIKHRNVMSYLLIVCYTC